MAKFYEEPGKWREDILADAVDDARDNLINTMVVENNIIDLEEGEVELLWFDYIRTRSPWN